MEEFELLMYPLEEDEFAIGNLREKLQLAVDEYNTLCKDMNLNESKNTIKRCSYRTKRYEVIKKDIMKRKVLNEN